MKYTNNLGFSDKVAIVTGAGQGIGFEICRQLAAQGATIFLNDIDEKLAHEAVLKISRYGNDCVACVGDSSDLTFIEEMTDMAIDRCGQIDILIANAGITLFGDFFEYPPSSLKRVLDVNLAGTFFLTQAVARQMREQGGGSILFTSSVTGHQAHKDLAAYGMTKAALEMLAKNLVLELAPYGINVNTVAPGATLTERTMEDPNYRNTWAEITPMGRAAYTCDIAAAALFLVSESARHITGQSLIVDGGWTAVSPSPGSVK